MKNLVSIGEIAKKKEVTIKALHHYEKIGILIPAYVDPDTGYRYYDHNQMLIIDMIKFMRMADIPLSKWHDYYTKTGEFDMMQLLADIEVRIQEKTMEIQICAKRLQLARNAMIDSTNHQNNPGPYQKILYSRNTLRQRIEDPASVYLYHEALTNLFHLAKNHRLAANYPAGLMAEYTHGQITFYAFLSLYEICPSLPEYFQIPSGNYTCIKAEAKSIVSVREAFPDYFKDKQSALVIETDCLPSPMEFRLYPMELQFLE